MSMQVRVGLDHVVHGLEPLARLVDGRAVGQVTAGGERQAEDGVARLGERVEHALVGLRARVRLHVGEAAAEQLLGAIDGEFFGDVDVLAAAVVALARIAFGVLVGEHAAGGIEHGLRDDVLRRDQLDLVLLAAELLLDGAENSSGSVSDRCDLKKREVVALAAVAGAFDMGVSSVFCGFGRLRECGPGGSFELPCRAAIATIV